jgi:hypothetical protein
LGISIAVLLDQEKSSGLEAKRRRNPSGQA